MPVVVTHHLEGMKAPREPQEAKLISSQNGYLPVPDGRVEVLLLKRMVYSIMTSVCARGFEDERIMNTLIFWSMTWLPCSVAARVRTSRASLSIPSDVIRWFSHSVAMRTSENLQRIWDSGAVQGGQPMRLLVHGSCTVHA